MIRLIYRDNEMEMDNPVDAMSKITELSADSSFVKEMMVIESVGSGYLEFALGLAGESVIIYTPEDENVECKISCNKDIQKATVDELKVKALDGEVLELTHADTVPLDAGLRVVEAYLTGNDFVDIIDWYVF